MYPTTGATIRGDINTVVEEAFNADKTFIGQLVMPMLPVDVKSGTYPKLTKTLTGLLDSGGDVRAPNGSYPRNNRAWTTDTYDTIDRGLEETIDDTDAKDLGRFFDLEAAKARWCMRSMMLGLEIRVAAAIINATTFGAGTNSAVAYTVANKATVDFPQDVLAAIERVNAKGAQANTIILSDTLLARLKFTTLLQNFIRGSRPSDGTLNITANSIQQGFADSGITQVLVGKSRYNSAKKGQTAALTSIWGTTYVWVGQVESGPANNGGAGRTLVWNKEGGLFVSETYRDEGIRSNVVRVRQHTAEKVIDAESGTLIATQYS